MKRSPKQRLKLSAADRDGSGRFVAGNAGGPGRPRGARTKPLTSALIKVLEGNKLAGVIIPEGKTVADVVAEALILHAIKGNGTAIREVFNRIEGLVLTEVLEDAEAAQAISSVFGMVLKAAHAESRSSAS